MKQRGWTRTLTHVPTVAQPQTVTGRQIPQPVDPPMVPFAVAGIVAWLIAVLVMIPFRDTHESWFWICVAGLLWGIPGLLTMIRHDAKRRRRRASPSAQGPWTAS